ncbi:hypothetical protein BDZ45DRAFT_82275 [Acephala macrosclerotiorum]|nr:hypothetical protein BDZ45DRAFT_82275 [Acephala macrosclerotiorum]
MSTVFTSTSIKNDPSQPIKSFAPNPTPPPPVLVKQKACSAAWLHPPPSYLPQDIMTSNESVPDFKLELSSFEERVKARKEAEKYAPWHPKNVLLHPNRTWRLAFGIIGDSDMEHALAHMDSGTAGSKDKPRPKPKRMERLFG